MVGLFVVPWLKERLLLTVVWGLSSGLGLEFRLMWEWWAAEPRLLLLLLKAIEGDWTTPPHPPLAMLWLRKKWAEEEETRVETGEAVLKDGMSSTSSMSKDLFSAARGKKKHESLTQCISFY